MKAITVRQPWASLIASGTKIIETRGWRTRHRGPIAIHAAKGWTVEEMRLALDLISSGRLQVEHLRDLPRGSVIATAVLVDVVRTEDVTDPVREWQLPYGDFTPGRWAWVLANIRAVAPEPARGRLGLWPWNE